MTIREKAVSPLVTSQTQGTVTSGAASKVNFGCAHVGWKVCMLWGMIVCLYLPGHNYNWILLDKLRDTIVHNCVMMRCHVALTAGCRYRMQCFAACVMSTCWRPSQLQPPVICRTCRGLFNYCHALPCQKITWNHTTGQTQSTVYIQFFSHLCFPGRCFATGSFQITGGWSWTFNYAWTHILQIMIFLVFLFLLMTMQFVSRIVYCILYTESHYASQALLRSFP